MRSPDRLLPPKKAASWRGLSPWGAATALVLVTLGGRAGRIVGRAGVGLLHAIGLFSEIPAVQDAACHDGLPFVMSESFFK